MAKENNTQTVDAFAFDDSSFGQDWIRLGDEYVVKGVRYLRQERRLQARLFFDKAVQAYGEAQKLNPEDARVFGGLGSCLLHLGMRAQARQVLERGIELGDSKSRATYNWAVRNGQL